MFYNDIYLTALTHNCMYINLTTINPDLNRNVITNFKTLNSPFPRKNLYGDHRFSIAIGLYIHQ